MMNDRWGGLYERRSDANQLRINAMYWQSLFHSVSPQRVYTKAGRQQRVKTLEKDIQRRQTS